MPQAVNLTCEYKVDPIGLDLEKPRILNGSLIKI